MSPEQKKHLLALLSGRITPRRLAKMKQVVKKRTRHLTLVLEDIYQPHNASAVLRSCECFGIQDVHIIENRNIYQVNPDVVLGATKWLTLHQYAAEEHNTRSCIERLKQQGYRIVATTPHQNDCLLPHLEVDQKTALLFGTELEGLSREAIEMADAFVSIPMMGFSESLNISVSAAICLYHLTSKIRKSVDSWTLDEEEKTDILISWILQSVRNPDALINHLRQQPGKAQGQTPGPDCGLP